MRVNHAMLLNLINQRRDPAVRCARCSRTTTRTSAAAGGSPSRPSRCRRSCWCRACSSCLDPPDEYGRTLQLAPALQQDFALNQPLASFAQAAFDLIDPESETFALDVLSVVESILDDPFPVLMAQANKARDEAVASMKADGIEYEERMELLEEVTYPKPLAEPLEQALRLYRETHPWVLGERPFSEVGRARHVRVGPDVHGVHRLLRRHPLGGPRAALPERHLPGAAPDRPRAPRDRRARRHHRVARRDWSARSTRACSTSGRR